MAMNNSVMVNKKPSVGQSSENAKKSGTIRNERAIFPMTTKPSHLLDRIAMIIAAGCGLHCICFPFLFAITAVSGIVHFISRPLEIGFVASAFVLGVANLTTSFCRRHHRPECLVLFLAGMTLVVVHEFMPEAAVSAGVSVAGGVLIGSAHFRNIQLLRKCGCEAGTPCIHSGDQGGT
jgi:hypothetical protein